LLGIEVVAQSAHLRPSLIHRGRPQAGLNPLFGQDMPHLIPAYAGHVRGCGQRDRVRLVSVDGELDAQIRPRTQQVAQGVLDGLIPALVEPGVDQIIDLKHVVAPQMQGYPVANRLPSPTTRAGATCAPSRAFRAA